MRVLLIALLAAISYAQTVVQHYWRENICIELESTDFVCPLASQIAPELEKLYSEAEVGGCDLDICPVVIVHGKQVRHYEYGGNGIFCSINTTKNCNPPVECSWCPSCTTLSRDIVVYNSCIVPKASLGFCGDKNECKDTPCSEYDPLWKSVNGFYQTHCEHPSHTLDRDECNSLSGEYFELSCAEYAQKISYEVAFDNPTYHNMTRDREMLQEMGCCVPDYEYRYVAIGSDSDDPCPDDWHAIDEYEICVEARREKCLDSNVIRIHQDDTSHGCFYGSELILQQEINCSSDFIFNEQSDDSQFYGFNESGQICHRCNQAGYSHTCDRIYDPLRQKNDDDGIKLMLIIIIAICTVIATFFFCCVTRYHITIWAQSEARFESIAFTFKKLLYIV